MKRRSVEVLNYKLRTHEADEQVHQYLSNLITGIGVAGAPFLAAASGKSGGLFP